MSPLTEPTKLRLADGQPVATDLSYSNVSLLLHGEGANNSQTFIDNSPLKCTPNTTGTAVISTANFYTGSSSILVPDTSSLLSYLANGNNLAFGTGNFTLEFFCYATHPTSQYRRYMTMAAGTSNTSTYREITIRQTDSSRYQMFIFVGTTLTQVTSAVTAVRNAWVYQALVKNGSTFTYYVGTNGSTATAVTSLTSTADFNMDIIYIGFTGAETATGYYDEIRLTKNVIRPVTTYPTVPFPDF